MNIGASETRFIASACASGARYSIDASAITELDSAGAWLLQRLLAVPEKAQSGAGLALKGLRPDLQLLLDRVAQRLSEVAAAPATPPAAEASWRTQAGQQYIATQVKTAAALAFVGECAVALAASVRQPARIRWRPWLFNIRTAGFDALPIVGLLAFLLGIVVAYQGATQLRQYGASIFVADLVGLSMLREFAPLITAIIVAGRSGSAYAAQIGTMAVTEEIDALRTIGIPPIELLVLPKVLALSIALPLLTVFADVLGVIGGMLMAKAQLDVAFSEFTARLVQAVSPSTCLVGLGKAPVFAVIIAMVGCHQGFQTRGGADAVGRSTTRAVVQSIFLVIVTDALFSIVFSVLDL